MTAVTGGISKLPAPGDLVVVNVGAQGHSMLPLFVAKELQQATLGTLLNAERGDAGHAVLAGPHKSGGEALHAVQDALSNKRARTLVLAPPAGCGPKSHRSVLPLSSAAAANPIFYLPLEAVPVPELARDGETEPIVPVPVC